MKIKSVTREISYVVVFEEEEGDVEYYRSHRGNWSYPNKGCSYNPGNFLASKSAASFALDKILIDYIDSAKPVKYADSLYP